MKLLAFTIPLGMEFLNLVAICGKKMRCINPRDTWWWNPEAHKAIIKKKEPHKAFCENGSDKNYISKKRKSVQEMEKLSGNLNKIFQRMKLMKKKGNDVESGQCMRGRSGQLGFIKYDEGQI